VPLDSGPMIAEDWTGQIPTVLSIDVEPDGTSPRPADRWPGFEQVLAYADELRDRLAGVTGAPARFTWALRMDPQIEGLQGSATWLAERYGATLDRLRAAGDAFGLHTHAWRRAGGSDPAAWVADWADEAWADECVEVALAAYASAFGRPCEIHRFGDHYTTARLHALLGARGVKVDLTIEPGARAVTALYRGWHGTGRLIDYAAAPRAPYLADPRDPRRPSSDPAATGPWLVPLTAVDASGWLPAWHRLARAVRYPGRVRHRPIVLWAPGPADALWAAVARELRNAPRPYLAFAIRSDVLASPHSAVPFRAKVDALLRSSLAPRLRVTDPISALASLGLSLASPRATAPQPTAPAPASASVLVEVTPTSG
jgi:hypothetical protein